MVLRMTSTFRPSARSWETIFLLILATIQQQYALNPTVQPSTTGVQLRSRRHFLVQWMLPAALLLRSSPAPANAACEAGDLDVGKCLGYNRQMDDGSSATVAPYKEAAERVAADLDLVKGWRALVGQSKWEEIGLQVLGLTPRLRSGSNLYCEALIKTPLTGGGFEGMSAFRQVETCRYAYEDANVALKSFESAVAAAYRSSGGEGVLSRFGGAGEGGASTTLQQSLAVLSKLNELEVRMYILAASLGLVTLRMEPEVVEPVDSR